MGISSCHINILADFKIVDHTSNFGKANVRIKFGLNRDNRL